MYVRTGNTIESATEYLDRRKGRALFHFFSLICFIHHLRLGCHLFRGGWQLLKARLDKIDPVRKRRRPSAGRPLGERWSREKLV